MTRYLTQDIIGAASRIVYGRKGDIVNLLKTNGDMILVQNKEQLFYVKEDKLSKEKVDPTPQVATKSTKHVQQIRKRKR